MIKVFKIIPVLVFLTIWSCKQDQSEVVKYNYVDEPHSFSQPNKAVIIHLSLDIKVDFENKIVSGVASYDIESNQSEEIILDSKFLIIKRVFADGKETNFRLGEFDQQLGQALKISIKHFVM